MIRINRMTDYAVVAMTKLIAGDGAKVTASDLAMDSGLPEPAVAKLLKELARAGLLVSRRGAGGGYGLGRQPQDISVADVVTALEGPIALTACVNGAHGGCEVESLCPIRGNWDQVNQAIRGALESVTLLDMAGHEASLAAGRAAVAQNSQVAS